MRQLTSKTQGFAKFCFVVAFLPLLLTYPVHSPAQNTPRWTVSIESDSAWLTYGEPEIAEFEISFQCQVGNPDISGNFYFFNDKLRQGEAVAVSLIGGKMELVSDTAVQEDPNAGGWRVEFHHPLNKATESALRSSMPLNIKIIPYKISKNFSRNGQDQAVAEFLEACSGFARDSMRLSSRGVPASFDCKKATRPVDQFICGSAALRWQDLALARSYRAALNVANPEFRQTLQNDQRRWIRERDQQCAGKRSLKALQKEAGNAAYHCLLGSYQKQREGLIGAAPNWWARGVTETAIKDIALARPDWQAEDRSLFGGSLSPDSLHLALLLPDDYGADALGANQVWLYHAGMTNGVAVTPNPSGRVPGADNEVMRIDTLAWGRDNTLYVRAWLWGGKGEQHTRATYAAAPSDRTGRLISETPAIKVLLDKAEQEKQISIDVLPEEEQDAVVPNAVWGNAKHLVWVADRAHGTMELLTQENKPGAQPYLISWGGWELTQAVFDAGNGWLLYPGDFGFKLIELDTRKEWDIVIPGPQSRPLAMVPETTKVGGTRIAWIEPILPHENVPGTASKTDQPFRILNAVLLPMPEDDE